MEASGQNGTVGASIDPVKEKEIRSLLELVGARDAIQDASSAATEQYQQKVIETSANNERAHVIASAYLADFQKEFQKKFDADAVTGQLVGIYDKHFTEDEIRDLLEFYGSPLGQKVAAEMPKISRESQRSADMASSQAARLAWQDLRAEYPNVSENVHRATASRRNANINSHPRPAGVEQASTDPQ